jgi:hypothetical protein
MEILEISDDGTFDVPSPTRAVRSDPIIIEPSIESIDRAAADVKCQNLKSSMQSGEYKIYKSGSKITVLIRVEDSEQPSGVTIDRQNKIRLKVSAEITFVIGLPNGQYDYSNLTSKRTDGFAIVMIDTLS